MIGRRAAGAVAAALAAGAALAAIPVASGSPAPVHAAVSKVVKVRDYYLAPKSLTVRPGTTIVWKWPSLDNAGDSHDVALKRRPKGVRAFHSDIASSDYTFKHKLRVKGKYVVICTLHPYQMRQTITVR